ncbi:MAG: hypothetical protein PF689_09245 [Deltaproteobacteria bacterium]|jgi:hypothetical protein|nr:hypothetical protein [Deltaproteobacteria bacterium]
MKNKLFFLSLLFISALQFSYLPQASAAEYYISREYKLKFPLPKDWLHGKYNSFSNTKVMLYHPTGARISLVAADNIKSEKQIPKWIKTTKKVLKNRKFNKFTEKPLYIGDKKVPGKIVIAKKNKNEVIIVHLLHNNQGFVLGFSCQPKPVSTSKKIQNSICKNRQIDFYKILANLTVF